MTTFNDLLSREGVNPKEVSLLRHQTRRKNGRTVYDFRRSDRPGFELYQSAQEAGRPVFSQPRYWASFVVRPDGRTIFVGLYEIILLVGKQADWLDPFTLEPIGAGTGKKYDLYDTKLSPLLHDLIDKLEIEWDRKSVRSWARHAASTNWLTRAINSQSNPISALALSNQSQAVARRTLLSLGFKDDHETDKVWRLRRDDLAIYVKKETERLPVIIHPWFETAINEIAMIDNIRIEEPFKFYINSNLANFPKWISDDRSSDSRYGIALSFDNMSAAVSLVELLEQSKTIETLSGPVHISFAGRSRQDRARGSCAGASRSRSISSATHIKLGWKMRG